MMVAPGPVVSVIVANFNGGDFIEDALASAARQTLRDIEIIVVDDASTDDSVGRVRAFAARDARVRLIQMPQRSGPGGARNQGLLAATGTWIAVLDSDDLMHPRRLDALIEIAARSSAELVADNQMVFDNERLIPARPLLAGDQLPQGGVVGLVEYIDSNALFSAAVPLGYLKPLILRSFLEQSDCRYDPTLVIAEDFDLVLRLLLAGGRFRVSPELTYFYRRHSRSVSHRLSAATLLPMLAADMSLRKQGVSEPVAAALARRRNTILSALNFDVLVDAIKRRKWREVLRVAYRTPGAAALLLVPLRDRLRRIARGKPLVVSPGPPQPRVSLISRQRIVGRTNGSSTYLLGLCDSLKQAGYAVDLISPSPAMFGRWPLLRFEQSMDVFASISIRGSFRVGRIVVARDPRIALRAAAGIACRLLGWLHISVDRLDRKAAHAIAVPLTNADKLFVAGAARRSIAILTDYAFLNEAIPFALQPRVPSAVVMHDLFCAQDAARSVIRLDQPTEMALLDQADAVIAIQSEEAETIRQQLPGKHVILAPMAVSPVLEAQPGDNGTILFVGSNTIPNIDGIAWFLSEVWPQLLERAPQTRLRIAGTCCAGVSGSRRNVSLLGKVDDLTDLYRDAAIVISPLRLGSGLKIKLVEALGRGKATVVTQTTLQGVAHLVQGGVLQADQASEFLDAFATLLHDRAARLRLGNRALDVALRHFSSEACHGGLLEFVGDARRGSIVASRRPNNPAEAPTERAVAE